MKDFFVSFVYQLQITVCQKSSISSDLYWNIEDINSICVNNTIVILFSTSFPSFEWLSEAQGGGDTWQAPPIDFNISLGTPLGAGAKTGHEVKTGQIGLRITRGLLVKAIVCLLI